MNPARLLALAGLASTVIGLRLATLRLTNALEETTRLRWEVLSDPEAALRRYCGPRPPQPTECRPTVQIRTPSGRWQDACLRQGDGRSSQPRRWYVIRLDCQAFSWLAPLPVIEVRLLR